jgi:hypothetical protein
MATIEWFPQTKIDCWFPSDFKGIENAMMKESIKTRNGLLFRVAIRNEVCACINIHTYETQTQKNKKQKYNINNNPTLVRICMHTQMI